MHVTRWMHASGSEMFTFGSLQDAGVCMQPQTPQRNQARGNKKQKMFLPATLARRISHGQLEKASGGSCTRKFVLSGGSDNLRAVEIMHGTVGKRRRKVPGTRAIGTKLERRKSLATTYSHNTVTGDFTFVRRQISWQEPSTASDMLLQPTQTCSVWGSPKPVFLSQTKY